MNVWDKVVDTLKVKLGSSSFNSWLAPLSFENFQDGKLLLAAPNSFIADFCAKNYKDDILGCLSQKFDDVYELDFCVNEKCTFVKSEIQAPLFEQDAEKDENPSWFLKSVLKNEWTFENFVVDSANEFAYKACVKIANDPSFAYNPVFLYAGIGLGKTHLLHAIANHIAQNNPRRKVLYISARQFTNSYVKSIQNNTTFSFKEQFSQYDVLLMDDLQFIDGKKSTQEEFLHIFSELVAANKQIILAGNKSLSSLTAFSKNLKSQIISGLTVDMARPAYETRVKILESKQKILGSQIMGEHLAMIAKTITTNVRELEGAFRRIVAYQELSGELVNKSIIENVLKDMVISSEPEVSAEEIIKKTCAYFEMPVGDMLSAKREKQVCYCRQIAMSLVKELTSHSYPEIGKKFGNKDHASVMYSCRQIEARKEFEPRINVDMGNIKEALGF
ncbi:MAG: chromosomal replication initiator protein DnaA [Rickettsiales bacterium]|nr:chromosomal replication initiator protein DnaA [Rickettsiales bacterium]